MEEPAESMDDRYWRSRAYSREATMSKLQMYICSVGFQARRSATGGSPPFVSGVRRSDRWTRTARRGLRATGLGRPGSGRRRP
jgi:hypothetical protein